MKMYVTYDDQREIEVTADWFSLRAMNFTPAQIVRGFCILV